MRLFCFLMTLSCVSMAYHIKLTNYDGEAFSLVVSTEELEDAGKIPMNVTMDKNTYPGFYQYDEENKSIKLEFDKEGKTETVSIDNIDGSFTGRSWAHAQVSSSIFGKRLAYVFEIDSPKDE